MLGLCQSLSVQLLSHPLCKASSPTQFLPLVDINKFGFETFEPVSVL